MKKILIGFAIAIILLISIVLLMNKEENKERSFENNLNKTGKMEIKSVFGNGEQIPEKYTADGDNVNPPLEISGIPINTKSLILIIDDPDALNGVWDHWIVFNIPVSGESLNIKENKIPGNQGINSWNKIEYGGPSPPQGSGTHRYFFKVYAIDTNFNFNETPNKEELLNAIKNHILDKAELVGVYSRD
jgi:Raf kinase inhibitor-like YbhB/YbcL family protein